MFSPVDPHVLYYATNVLFKTTDGGSSWETISKDLTRESPGVASERWIPRQQRSREAARSYLCAGPVIQVLEYPLGRNR